MVHSSTRQVQITLQKIRNVSLNTENNRIVIPIQVLFCCCFRKIARGGGAGGGAK